MKSTILVAAALVGLANAIPDSSLHLKHMGAFRPRDNQGVELPATAPALNIQTVQGCFSSSGDLKFDSNQTYNSISSCVISICLAGGYAVGGTSGGKECWCGNTYPALDTMVKDSECNTPCTGYGLQACGGANTWTIYNTGLSVSVKYMPNTTSSQSSASSSAPATAVVTLGGQTVIVTQAAAAESSDASTSSGGGSSVGGIVAGVVVGVVVIASAVGGVFLYMRRRRNQELEEEFRRNASVNDFFGKPPGSSGGMSATDSRLDPVLAQRRMSDGSIADNQDYSRRILRVTNA